MLATPFMHLQKALYEWNKECPKDLQSGLTDFFRSKEFLDRGGVFFKGIDDRTGQWQALISMSGVEETRSMICSRFSYTFMELYAYDGTYSQVSEAPRLPLEAAYKKYIKDIAKLNRLTKSAERLKSWRSDLSRATALVQGIEGMKEDKPGMWFISVDIESYERDHDKILEIGWSTWDAKEGLFLDKHYAISDYRHLHNGKFVSDRRDRFMFGETVWASLQDSISAFQQDLELASRQNESGSFVLIAHDMASDETYLRKMGVHFPAGMIQFDTVQMNCARQQQADNKTGLGKLLDELSIENYCLHNAGNDAHYTLELFLWLVRDHAAIQQHA